MSSSVRRALILGWFCIVLFILGSGILTLTHPDEVFYAGTAKEMLARGDWWVPYLFGHPQFEKPIFYYWELLASFKALGVTPFAARLPGALFACFGVFLTFMLGKKLFADEKKAFWGALVLATSAVYIGLARAVLTDMTFSVWILASVTAFYYGYADAKKRALFLVLAWAAAGFAVLTKGPLGLLIPGVIAVGFLAIRREWRVLASRGALWGGVLFLLISLPWYADMVGRYGHAFTHEFFYNDHIRRLFEAEHRSSDRWHFYPLTMILGLWPWMFFFLAGLVAAWKNARRQDPAAIFLLIWLAVVLGVFQVAHSKLASYVLPVFPALALMTGAFLVDRMQEARARLSWTLPVIGTMGLVVIFLAIVWGARFFAEITVVDYLGSLKPVFVTGAGLLILIALLAWALRSGARTRFVQVLVFFWAVILAGLPIATGALEPFVSMARSAEVLRTFDNSNDIVLTSKFCARAVWYYTGREVAVINFEGKNYFSPHPIRFLKTEAEIASLVAEHGHVYGIVDDDILEHVHRNKFRLGTAILKKVGGSYIVRFTPGT